jgi:hypothetical protein
MVDGATKAMSKTLDSILAAPPLQRITPAAREAIASVSALAAQQAADLPASASPFEPAPETPERFNFSFSLDTEDRIFDVASARSLLGEVTKSGGVFKATIHF